MNAIRSRPTGTLEMRHSPWQRRFHGALAVLSLALLAASDCHVYSHSHHDHDDHHHPSVATGQRGGIAYRITVGSTTDLGARAVATLEVAAPDVRSPDVLLSLIETERRTRPALFLIDPQAPPPPLEEVRFGERSITVFYTP